MLFILLWIAKKVQSEEQKTDSELKAELKQLDSKLALIDKYAVQKIANHARRPRGPKTVEEKNLNRRKRYISMREKAVLDELDKAEKQLFSVTPTFQSSMKDSLRMIFKNEDKKQSNIENRYTYNEITGYNQNKNI